MEEKDVDDDRAKDHQGEGDVAIHQEQHATEQLKREDDHPVLRNENGGEELGGYAGGRRHGNEMQETVQAEDEEDETKKQPRDKGYDFHNISFRWNFFSAVYKLAWVWTFSRDGARKATGST